MDEGQDIDYAYKLVLVGDGNVGKTSMIIKYVMNKFSEKYLRTIGTRVYKKELGVNIKGEKKAVKLMIWDTTGQRGFDRILSRSLKGAKGALVVCDITRKETLDNLEVWLKDISLSIGPVPVTIIANKSDLKDQYQFTPKELEEVGKMYDAPTFVTSAKTGVHIENVFHTISRDCILVGDGKKKPPSISEILGINIDMERKENKIFKNPRELEDYIIADFCKYFGHDETAMHIVRQQLKKLNIDFVSPRVSDLRSLNTTLVNITSQIKGDKEAKNLKRDILNAITKFDKQNR